MVLPSAQVRTLSAQSPFNTDLALNLLACLYSGTPNTSSSPDGGHLHPAITTSFSRKLFQLVPNLTSSTEEELV